MPDHKLRLIYLFVLGSFHCRLPEVRHRTSWWHSWVGPTYGLLLHSLLLRGIPRYSMEEGDSWTDTSCQKQSLYDNLLGRAKNSASIPLNLTPTHISKSSIFQWRILSNTHFLPAAGECERWFPEPWIRRPEPWRHFLSQVFSNPPSDIMIMKKNNASMISNDTSSLK